MQSNWKYHRLLMGMQSSMTTLEFILAVSYEIRIHLPYAPVIIFLDICPREMKVHFPKNLYANVHSICIPHCQELEIVQMSIISANKQTTAYPYDELLLNHKTERITDTCNNMNGLQNIMPRKRSQTQKMTFCLFLFYLLQKKPTLE